MIYKPNQGLITAGGFRTNARYEGCISHWLMNDGGGLTSVDISSFGNNGALSGGPAWVAGMFGPALNFDGADDVVNAGTPAALTNVIPVSITAWIYPTGWGGGGGFGRIFSKESGPFSDNTRFYVGDATARALNFLSNYSVTNPVAVSSVDAIVLNQWSFVVGTFKESDGGPHLYVNGIETSYASRIAESGTHNTDAANSALIGNRGDLNRGFSGRIDDVQIFNQALTATDIASMYNNPFLEFFRARRPLAAPLISSPTRISFLPMLGVGR